MLKVHRRRSITIELIWPSQPRRSLHPDLGRRLVWADSRTNYEIVCFPHGTGRYLIFCGRCKVGEKRKLCAAKRVCESHFRANFPG